VHVVRDHQHRYLGRRVGQQFQRGQPDHRHGRRWPRRHPQRRQQGLPLAGRQGVRTGQHRPHQLVQPGERQVCLTGDPLAGQHAHAPVPGTLARRLGQRRLADARITDRQQRSAAISHASQQRLQCRQLRVPSHQRGHHR
jgi:hypothetical protein